MNSVMTLARQITGRGGPRERTRPAVSAVAPGPIDRRLVMPGYVARSRKSFGWRRKLGLVALTVVSFVYCVIVLLFPRQLLPMTVMPVVMLWCMVVWAMPVREKMPGGLMPGLFLAYCATLALWPSYLALQIPGLPWITTARLLGAPLVLLLVFHGFTSGPFRRQMLERLRSAKWIVRGVIAFAVLQTISIALSSAPFATFNKVLNNQITWTGMFFASVWFFSDEGRFRKWIYLMSGALVIVAIIAIVESRYEMVLWANSIPSFLKVDDTMVDAILAGTRRFYGGYRAVATSTTPLSLAELAAGAAPMAFYFLYSLPKPKGLLLFLGFLALMITTVVMTDSRMGVGTVLFSVMCMGGWAAVRFIRQNPNGLLAPVLSVGTPLLLFLVFLATLFVGRINNVVWGHSGQASSDSARMDQIAGGLVKIWESPVLGFGASQGAGKLGYVTVGGKPTIDTYYLSILLDYGFVGFFLFYGLFLIATWKAWAIAFRRADELATMAAIWASALTIYLITKSVLSQELNHPMIFIGFGAVVSLCWMDKKRQAGVTNT